MSSRNRNQLSENTPLLRDPDPNHPDRPITQVVYVAQVVVHPPAPQVVQVAQGTQGTQGTRYYTLSEMYTCVSLDFGRVVCFLPCCLLSASPCFGCEPFNPCPTETNT